MYEIDPGHKYSLSPLDGPIGQTLTFVKREGTHYPGNEGHYCGTTSQEVLRALLYRAVYVNQQKPCWQTQLSMFLLETIIWLYEHRAAKLHGRKPPSRFQAVFYSTCPYCGHVNCYGECGRH